MKPVLALAFGLLLIACSNNRDPEAFDRPGLLQQAPQDVRDDLERADRHVLVVRHARKVAPDCNALDCALSPRGETMVAALGSLIGAPPVDMALSSSACRTVMTARAGGRDVVPHQASNGIAEGCEPGQTIERRRGEAMADVLDSEARWTLVAEHSNTVCAWIVGLSGQAGAEASGCEEGRVADDAYGAIYWLYRIDGAWALTVLPGAFEVAEASETAEAEAPTPDPQAMPDPADADAPEMDGQPQ